MSLCRAWVVSVESLQTSEFIFTSTKNPKLLMKLQQLAKQPTKSTPLTLASPTQSTHKEKTENADGELPQIRRDIQGLNGKVDALSTQIAELARAMQKLAAIPKI